MFKSFEVFFDAMSIDQLKVCVREVRSYYATGLFSDSFVNLKFLSLKYKELTNFTGSVIDVVCRFVLEYFSFKVVDINYDT